MCLVGYCQKLEDEGLGEERLDGCSSSEVEEVSETGLKKSQENGEIGGP